MKVQMFTKTGCPFCVAAKQWFNDNKISFNEVVLDDNQQRQSFYQEAYEQGKVDSPIRTVPQIFIEDKHIGGFDDLRSASNEILAKKGV